MRVQGGFALSYQGEEQTSEGDVMIDVTIVLLTFIAVQVASINVQIMIIKTRRE